MADDWVVGDLALCVAQGSWCDAASEVDSIGPTSGQVLQVVRVGQCIIRGTPMVFLVFAAFGLNGYVARAFRKITPGAEIVGVEAETRIAVPHLMPERGA